MASFNFLDCPGLWETKQQLRRRATNLKILVQDSKGRKRVSPTLKNLELNQDILKPITATMAKYGYMDKNVEILKEALRVFYTEHISDEDKIQPIVQQKLTTLVSGTAYYVGQMLTVLKRKWSKWELPRVPGLPLQVRLCY